MHFNDDNDFHHQLITAHCLSTRQQQDLEVSGHLKCQPLHPQGKNYH